MTRDHGFHPLRVLRVVDETHDTKSFVFDVPPELRDAFAYRPGQFCSFRIRRCRMFKRWNEKAIRITPNMSCATVAE